MIGKLNVSDGVNINGIIKEYQVANGKNISAGDFVNFINNYNTSKQTLSLYFSNSIDYLDAILLDDTRVFVSCSTNSTPKAFIIEIDNGTLTSGTLTQISSSSSNPCITSSTMIGNDKIFMSYFKYASSIYTLYGIVLNINNMDIITGTETVLDTQITHHCCSVANISENKVIVEYSKSNILNFGICTINSQDEISFGDITVISNSTLTDKTLRKKLPIISIDNNVIFIYGIDANIRAKVCNIENNIITFGTEKSITNSSAYITNAGKIDNSTIFIGIEVDMSSYGYQYGIIIKINTNNLTIDAGTLTQISTLRSSSTQGIFFNISETFFQTYLNDGAIYGAELMFNGLTFGIGNSIGLSNGQRNYNTDKDYVNISDSTILMIASRYSSSSYECSGFFISNNVYVQPILSKTDAIKGISTQDKTSGENIKIAIPDV